MPERKAFAIAPLPLYHSSSGRRNIVLADTGYVTNHAVGSREEYMYYKVGFNACSFDKTRSRHSATLFYNSPREYCVHYLTHLLPAAQSVTPTTLCNGHPIASNFRQRRVVFPEDEIALERDVRECLAKMGPEVDKWTARKNKFLEEQEAKRKANDEQLPENNWQQIK